MKLKRILAVGAVCAVLTGTLAVSASAHGGCCGGGGRYRAQTNYATCTYSGCTLGYDHQHDGTTYCGHASGYHHR